MACNPALLIADEPTTALDVTIQAQILALLARLRAETGMGILFITHNLGVVAEIADRVTVMYAGQVVEAAATAPLFAHPRHPYTAALLSCLPARALHGADGRRTVQSIPGAIDAAAFVPGRCSFAPRCAEVRRDLPQPDAGVGSGRTRRIRALPQMAGGGMTGAPLLAVDGLTKHFGHAPKLVRAVEDVSFAVAPGEVLGLVGESGSGKSTIGRLILRLLEPTAGRIAFAGQEIAGLPERRLRFLRRQAQMVFQDPYASLNPRLRVRDIIGEALSAHGLARGAARRERIASLLEMVGLSADHMARFPHEFSGGQRQRIGIARALAVEPKLIVADEPVSALDVSVQAQVLNLMQDLRRRLGLAMLFISHDLDVVELMCDRIAVLYLGRIMEIGTATDICTRPRHPYTRALMAASPKAIPGAPKPERLLKGDIPSPLAPPSGCVFRTRCPIAIPECAGDVPPLRPVSPDHRVACIRSETEGRPAPA